jgi:UDP-N-acetylmuramoylalanine--D-glutamate ligase
MNQKTSPSIPSSAMTLESLALQGQRTIRGTLAAAIAPRVKELRKAMIKECFSRPENVEHRMEYVANVHGIEFINDSKATNTNATWYSLDCLTKPVIWIAGGMNMGGNFDILEPLVKSKVKAIVCLGLDCKQVRKILTGFGKPYSETDAIHEALELALYAAEDGDVVLFSPACASFDLYKDYEERGREFKDKVRNL